MSSTGRTERSEFAVPFEGIQLHAEYWSGPSGANALILHGGGQSSSLGLAPLREHLLARGIGSLTLDFIGHGRTGGSLIGSSLASRLAQIDALLQAHPLEPQSSGVIGFSMGGHIAALTAARRRFAACGLVIPAAYTAAAAALPFGPAFSAALRQPGSWRDSDAFEAIAGYRGRLQIVSGEHDAIVPAEIPARYASAALAAAQVRHHVVLGAGHDLSALYDSNPSERERIYDQLASMIRPAT